MTTRPPEQQTQKLLDWDEFHVQGLGLVLQVFEARAVAAVSRAGGIGALGRSTTG